MQPQRATRGIAAVALSTAGVGILLLALALLLSGCSASSAGSSSASAATTSAGTATASTPAPAASSGSTAPPSSTAAPSSPAPPSSTASSPAAPPADGTVPSVPVTTAPAVPLTAAAPAAGGGAITIGAITGLQGTAQLPGEAAGPAVRVPVTIRNGSGAAIDLDQVVVDLVDRAGVSAGPLTADPAAPFQGSLAPGATARATYVFSLATDDRRGVSIIVSYTTAAPVVVFTGTIA